MEQNTVLKFWTKRNAQKVADRLNHKYSQYDDFCFPWEIKRLKFRYLIVKKYYGNIGGTYTVVAQQRHIGA